MITEGGLPAQQSDRVKLPVEMSSVAQPTSVGDQQSAWETPQKPMS